MRSGEKFLIFNIRGLFSNKIKCDKECEYFNMCSFE